MSTVEEKARNAMMKRQYDTAIEFYLEAYEEDKNNIDSIMWIALCFQWKGNIKQAVIFAERYLKDDPSNYEMLAILWRHLDEQQDRDKLYKYACRYIDNQPEKIALIPNWFVCFVSPILWCFDRLGIDVHPNKPLIKKNKEMNEMLVWARSYKKAYEENYIFKR